MTKRSGYFDALKGILIILVLIGHFGGDNTGHSAILWTIETFIYMFHMPVFVFISGYFSKNTEKAQQSGFDILITYFIFNIMWALVGYIHSTDNSIVTAFYLPAPALWYLLALSVWRYYLKKLIRIKFILPLSFIVAGISILFNIQEPVMAIPRIIGFLPFFLLGYYIDKATVEKIKKINPIIGVLILAVVFVITYMYIYHTHTFDIKLLAHNYSYLTIKPLNNNVTKALISNYISYIIAIVSGLGLLIIGTLFENTKWLIKIGQRTMPIYILSGYIQRGLLIVQRKYMQGFLTSDYMNYGFSLIIIVLTIIILSSNFVQNIFNTFLSRIKKYIII